MGVDWYKFYKIPITLPTEPLSYDGPYFEKLFIRTKIYDELDPYLEEIKTQQGKFWVTSKGSGYGKSTFLNYIMRFFYKKMDKLATLPLFIRIGGSGSEVDVRKRFFREFLQQLLSVDENLKKFEKDVSQVLTIQILKEFNKYRAQIKELSDQIPTLSIDELERKFWQACEVLKIWKSLSIFNRFVLLIDEMDKLPEEATLFLSRGQTIFERLYNDFDVIVFFSSEFSWVSRLHAGTEYTYYRGKTFETPPLLDINDVKSLVESRLNSPPLYMQIKDIPWTGEGYSELRKLTDGQPRSMLNLAAQVMNDAARAQIGVIKPGQIHGTLTKQLIPKVREYLGMHYATYEKFIKAKQIKWWDKILIVYYSFSYRHEIPKVIDENQDKRTQILGFEVNDKDWQSCIEALLRVECLNDKKITRALAPDMVDFFKFLESHQAQIQLLSELLSAMSIEPRALKEVVEEPDYFYAIDRAFEIKSHDWLDEEELFKWFYDTTGVTDFFKQDCTVDPVTKAKTVFKRKLRSFLDDEDHASTLLTIEENGKKLFRRRPNFIAMESFNSIKDFGKEIIDGFIGILESKRPIERIADGKDVVEKIISLLYKKIGLESPGKILVDNYNARLDIYDRVKIPLPLVRRIEQFREEADSPSPNEDIVKANFKAAVEGLASFYRKIESPGKEISMEYGKNYANLQKIKEWLGHAEGEIKILDKHFDEKALDNIYSALDPSKITSLKILCYSHVSKKLRKEYFDFKKEMTQKGMNVQIFVLTDTDASKPHDRYTIIVASGRKEIYNHPPMNAIIEKIGDIKKLSDESVKEKLQIFDEFWSHARPLDTYDFPTDSTKQATPL
jgi:hypothetical protein